MQTTDRRKYDSGPVGYYSKLERNAGTFKTENEISSSFAKDIDENFKEILNSPKKISAMTRTLKARNEVSQATVAIRVPTSNAAASVDSNKLKQLFSGLRGENFRDLFYETASIYNSENIRVTRDIVTSIVHGKLGEDVPSWVVDKFMKLCEESASYGELNWPLFRDIADKVLAASTAECLAVKSKPTWLNASNGDIASLETPVATSYQDDYCPIDSRDSSDFTSTTSHLFIGTSKATHRLPGYGGHIPENMNASLKQLHASGDIVREPHYDLRLTRPKAGYLPGYSGFVPVNAVNRLEKK